MNQHKDLLYRQKYATYQLNNRTFSTQNTKISARSLAISYICFQVRIVKKKRGGGKPYYQLLRKIWWLPHPRPPTPDKGSIREIATGEITLPITPDDHLEGPYLLKTRKLPGAPLCPCTPPGALRRFAHTRCATRTDFSATPFFANPGSATVHIPPLLVQVACPQRRRSWGSWGAVAPPPPNENIFLGGKHIVPPHPQ